MKYFPKCSSIVEYMGLFASVSTLMCCALPSLFVMLGLGVMFASLISVFPSLKWFGQHSTLLFVFAGIMLLINGFVMYQNRNKPCKIGKKAKSCTTSRRLSKYIFVFSVVAYTIALLAKFCYLLL